MERQKGIACCGLACAVCSENADCPGCRNEGCKNKEWCVNLRCCKEKELDGCWECDEFPCKEGMLDKLRIRAFALYVKKYGTESLVDRLGKNEMNGIRYHYPGKLTGDYDLPETEDGIIDMILTGKK